MNNEPYYYNSEDKLVFREGNNIPYGQDFRFFRGVPHNIPFDVEKSSASLSLKAIGYGVIDGHDHYGNGKIHICLTYLPNLETKEALTGYNKIINDILED